MRYGNKDDDWTGYLTDDEFARYEKERAARKWCFERMTDHERAIARLEYIAKTRRGEVRRKHEAAE